VEPGKDHDDFGFRVSEFGLGVIRTEV
jgi:hypothetical protein